MLFEYPLLPYKAVTVSLTKFPILNLFYSYYLFILYREACVSHWPSSILPIPLATIRLFSEFFDSAVSLCILLELIFKCNYLK